MTWLEHLKNIWRTPQEHHATLQERLLEHHLKREEERAQMLFEVEREELLARMEERKARLRKTEREERFLEQKREQMRANRKPAPKAGAPIDCVVCKDPGHIGLTAAQIIWHNGRHAGPGPDQHLVHPGNGKVMSNE